MAAESRRNPESDPRAPAPCQCQSDGLHAASNSDVDDLAQRLRFETVLSDLSARFINLPADQVDSEIEAGLRRLVECLGLDRSTLFQRSEDEKTLVVTHGWATPGFEVIKRVIAREELPWALRQVLIGETILFSSIEDLPEEALLDKATLRSADQMRRRHRGCGDASGAGTGGARMRFL